MSLRRRYNKKMSIELLALALTLLAVFLESVLNTMEWRDRIRRYIYLMLAHYLALKFLEKELEPKFLMREEPVTEETRNYEEKEIDRILNDEL